MGGGKLERRSAAGGGCGRSRFYSDDLGHVAQAVPHSSLRHRCLNLRMRLLSGVTQAESPELSRPSTSGNFILDRIRQPSFARHLPGGTGHCGARVRADLGGCALDRRKQSCIDDGIWGLNLVRLPFQAQTVLAGNGGFRREKFSQGWIWQ